MKEKRNWKGFFIYLVIGIVAIISLYPMQMGAVKEQLAQLKVTPPMPVEILAFVSLINPLILLIVALVVGFFIANKMGFKSLIIQPKQSLSNTDWKNGLKIAVILGVVLGVVIIGFDLIARPFLPEVLTGSFEAPKILNVITALLYGGIVEELLLRFGLMSLLVFLLWKIFDKKNTKPSNWIYLTAILLSAILFALGHYGATAAATEMTALIWARMILLNGLGGVFFGWIYWKYNLEFAMVSHMFAHITMNIIFLVLSFIV